MYGLLILLLALPFAFASGLILGHGKGLFLREKLGYGSMFALSYATMIYGFCLYDTTTIYGQTLSFSDEIISLIQF